ncbi:hypothetical protein AMECASPLE_004160, partial [Ameca splendens]
SLSLHGSQLFLTSPDYTHLFTMPSLHSCHGIYSSLVVPTVLYLYLCSVSWELLAVVLFSSLQRLSRLQMCHCSNH